jgi:hypothetical protein
MNASTKLIESTVKAQEYQKQSGQALLRDVSEYD